MTFDFGEAPVTRSARFRELLKKPPFVCLGAHDAVTAMLEGCSTNAIADRLTPFDEFNECIGLAEVVARQQRYAA
jgi:hypothetical protein